MWGLGGQLKDIQGAIKDVQGTLHKIELDQATMKEDLRHHIRRTDALEQAVLPLVTRKNYLDGILKAIGLLGLIVSVLGGLYKLLSK